MTPSDKTEPLVEPTPGPKPLSPAEIVERALRLRIRQQEILAELGVLALKRGDFLELLNRTVTLTAEGLQAEFCKILEYHPDESRLLIRAGYGWDPSIIGVVSVGADTNSPGGFALRTGRPVISNHLEHEERFKTPELLAEYGVRRAMNVVLQGEGSPYGVLEVDSRSPGEFTETDVAFLQGAANILGMAIERRRYESQLTAALDEHEILLSEMNHRVKNSLQLVSAMLTLQANGSELDDVKRTLTDASSRVLAIARVHDHLYRSKEVRVVDIRNYLRDICSNLERAIEGCQLEFEGQPGVQLAVDRAIPLALLTTELITNAAKYAYTDRQPGLVRVRLTADNANFMLTVSDNGVGLPPAFDIATTKSLGMRLVKAFAAQLSAELQHHSGANGTEFKLTVPLVPNPENSQ